MSKVKTADVLAQEKYDKDLKEWEKAEIKHEEKGPRKGEEYRVLKGTVTRVNQPTLDFPRPEVCTKVAVEGIWQELRDIKLLLVKQLK